MKIYTGCKTGNSGNDIFDTRRLMMVHMRLDEAGLIDDDYDGDYIKQKIVSDQRWMESAIMAIYANQTEDEKNVQSTGHRNSMGFSMFDAKILSSFAEWIQKGRHLTPKQFNAAKMMMGKYIRQLVDALMVEKGDGVVPPFGFDPGPVSPAQSAPPPAPAPVKNDVPPGTSLFDLAYKYSDLQWEQLSKPMVVYGAKVNYRAKSNYKFGGLWKENKPELKDLGFLVDMNEKREWYVYLKDTTPNGNKGVAKKVDAYLSTPTDNVANIKFSDILKDWQEPVARQALAALLHNKSVLDASGTGSGKCLAKDTPVLMFDGSIKMVQDIRPNELIMGDDNTPRKIMRTNTEKGKMYEIVLNSGTSFGCNEDHILVLRRTDDYRKTKETIEISVKDFLKKTKHFQRCCMMYCPTTHLVFDGEKKSAIDPYLCGLWLADGRKNMVSFSVNNKDTEIKEYLYGYCQERGFALLERNIQTNSKDLVFEWGAKDTNDILNYFKTIGVFNNKHIPQLWRTMPVEDRRLFLAGYIDGDGCVLKGNSHCYSSTSSIKEISEGIIFIAQSLGLSAKMKKRIKFDSRTKKLYTSYDVIIGGDLENIPVKLERKKIVSKRKYDWNVSGFKVVEKGIDDYYGFTIDGNGRFLLGNFYVTHNTFIALAVMKAAEIPFIVICPKVVVSQWEDVAEMFKIKPLLILNYESIKRGKTKFYVPLPDGQTNKSNSNMEWKVPDKTVIIFDEAHKTKNYKTANAKLLIDAVNQGISTYLMSATIGENPLKLFATGKALGLFDDKSYWPWAYGHGVVKGTWGMEFHGDADDMKNIHKDIFDTGRGVQVPRDVLTKKLPEDQRIVQCIRFDNQAKINQVYQELQQELENLAAQGKKDKTNVLTKRLRARQRVEYLKAPEMAEMAEDFIDDEKSVVIIVNFTETIDYLSKKLGTKCIIDGRYSGQRDKNKADFQADKERICLVNIKAGGVGVSLHDTHGKYPRVTLINPDDSAQNLVQALGRIVRTGGMSKCLQYILFAKGTIEEDIAANVRAKVNNINGLNDGDLAEPFLADYFNRMNEMETKAFIECIKASKGVI